MTVIGFCGLSDFTTVSQLPLCEISLHVSEICAFFSASRSIAVLLAVY